MLIPKRRIDDFKAERKSLLPPLPHLLRLVPILFYCAILMTVLLASIYVIQIGISQDRLQVLTRTVTQTKADIENAKAQRSNLEGRILKATDVQRWVEGSQPLQPLVVAINRSVKGGSSLVNLKLDRDEVSPTQILFEMRIGALDVNQLDDTLSSISGEGYRSFSPQQSVSGSEIDYKSTLVRQAGPGATSTTPTP